MVVLGGKKLNIWSMYPSQKNCPTKGLSELPDTSDRPLRAPRSSLSLAFFNTSLRQEQFFLYVTEVYRDWQAQGLAGPAALWQGAKLPMSSRTQLQA